MKAFKHEHAVEAADNLRKRAISQLEDLIASLNRSLTLMQNGKTFDLCDSPELRLKQVREEVEQAKLMAKLTDILDAEESN